jgi:hypothetical protein
MGSYDRAHLTTIIGREWIPPCCEDTAQEEVRVVSQNVTFNRGVVWTGAYVGYTKWSQQSELILYVF